MNNWTSLAITAPTFFAELNCFDFNLSYPQLVCPINFADSCIMFRPARMLYAAAHEIFGQLNFLNVIGADFVALVLWLPFLPLIFVTAFSAFVLTTSPAAVSPAVAAVFVLLVEELLSFLFAFELRLLFMISKS